MEFVGWGQIFLSRRYTPEKRTWIPQMMVSNKVTPLEYGHFWYLFVKFLGCTYNIHGTNYLINQPFMDRSISQPHRPYGLNGRWEGGNGKKIESKVRAGMGW